MGICPIFHMNYETYTKFSNVKGTKYLYAGLAGGAWLLPIVLSLPTHIHGHSELPTDLKALTTASKVL